MLSVQKDLASSSHPRYEQQIIFNFMGPEAIDALRSKTDKQYSFSRTTKVVSIDALKNGSLVVDTDLIKDACRDINNRTRIYINGNCAAGENFLTNSRGFHIPAMNIARLIATHTPKTSNIHIFRTPDQLKISLLSCHSGQPTPAAYFDILVNNSFAAHLLRHFNMQRINCVIAARLQSVPKIEDMAVESQFGDMASSKNNDRKKVLYSYSGGCQIILSAYRPPLGQAPSWRAQVFEALSLSMIPLKGQQKQHINILLNNILLSQTDLEAKILIERAHHYRSPALRTDLIGTTFNELLTSFPPQQHLPLHPRYEQIVIFNFLDDNNCIDIIRSKAEKQYRFLRPTRIINFSISSNGSIRVLNEKTFIEASADINSRTRIYIDAHTTKAGVECLFNDLDYQIPASQVATLITQHIPKSSDIFLSGTPQKLKISLTGCYAGAPSRPTLLTNQRLINNSFAARLLYELKYGLPYGVNCVIAARLHSVEIARYSDKPGFYMPLADKKEDFKLSHIRCYKAYERLNMHMFENAQRDLAHAIYPKNDDRKKVLYTHNDKGHQIISSAYHSAQLGHVKTWRAQAFDRLCTLISDISDPQTQECLKIALFQVLKASTDNEAKDHLRTTYDKQIIVLQAPIIKLTIQVLLGLPSLLDIEFV